MSKKKKTKQKFKPSNRLEERLVKAFASLRNEKESTAFLRDLLTPKEIEEFSNRLEIARLLTKGASYLDIANKTGTSTTTVSRVALWLFTGCGGYESTLKKID